MNNSSKETLEKEIGRIGMGALKLLDFWLLDFPRSALLVIRNLEEFEKDCRLSYNDFIVGPIDNWQNLIIININTDFGIKKFMLDTGCYHTLMRKPKDCSLDEAIETKTFNIFGKEFGSMEINLFELPKEFKFDGILGRDFLKQRAILFDFKDNKLFIGPTEKQTFVRIPTIMSNHQFYLKGLLEDHSCLLRLDIGSTGGFKLPTKLFENLKNKNEDKIVQWEDVCGNCYEYQTYLIDKCDIGNLHFTNFSTYFDNKIISTRLKNNLLKQNENFFKFNNDYIGSIGISLLRKIDCWLLDFPKKNCFLIMDLEGFEKVFRFPYSHFCIGDMHKEYDRIIIDIKTDFGMKKFVLSTTCEKTGIQKLQEDLLSNQKITTKFNLFGKDFGPMEMELYDFPEGYQFDGILGLDFLKNRAVILDFKNNKVFIGPKENALDSY